MTDRQVTVAAVITVGTLVGGAFAVTQFQAELSAVIGGSRGEGGGRGHSGGGAREGKAGSRGGESPEASPEKSDPKHAQDAGRASDRTRDKKADAKVRRSPVLAKWGVAGGFGTERGGAPTGIAVDDAGTRVLVQMPRSVNVWQVGNPVPLQLRPAGASGAFVAPDAVRVYFLRNEDQGWSLETCAADGRRVGVWEPDPLLAFGAVGFHPDTHELTVSVRGGASGALYTISPATGHPRPVRALADGSAADRIFPHAGGHVVYVRASGDDRRSTGLYSLTNADKQLAPVSVVVPPWGAAPLPAVSADGRRAAVPADGAVRVWDLVTGRHLFSRELGAYQLTGCWFVGERLVVAARGTASEPALLWMYDATSFRLLGQFRPGDFKLPEGVFAFSPDGSKLAAADGEGAVLADTNVAFGLSP